MFTMPSKIRALKEEKNSKPKGLRLLRAILKAVETLAQHKMARAA